MVERSLHRGNPAVVILAFGVFLRAAATEPQSAFPVRFADPLAEGGVTLPEQILDASFTTVAAPGLGSAELTVPTEEIAARCGDGDGCLLRIFQTAGETDLRGDLFALRRFSTSAIGTDWRSYELVDSDSWSQSGSTSDSTTKTIYQVGSGDERCLLVDRGTTHDYRLVAETLSPTFGFSCMLQIDD